MLVERVTYAYIDTAVVLRFLAEGLSSLLAALNGEASEQTSALVDACKNPSRVVCEFQTSDSRVFMHVGS